MTHIHKNLLVAPAPSATPSTTKAPVAASTSAIVDTVSARSKNKASRREALPLDAIITYAETLPERCKKVLATKCDVRGATRELNMAHVLEAFSEELKKVGLASETFLAGSVHAYLTTPEAQPVFPGDVDPIVYVDSELDEQALQQQAGIALDKAIKRLGGSQSSHVAYFKEDLNGNKVPYLRMGTHHVLDVRVLNKTSAFRPYDFVCNAGQVSLASLQARDGNLAVRGAGDLTAAQVHADLLKGVYTMDHALAGDSLYRVWKMLTKGRVPGSHNGPYEAALVPTLIASLQAEGRALAEKYKLDEDPQGLGLRLSTFVSRVLTGLPAAKQATLLTNAMVHLRQYHSDDPKLQEHIELLVGLINGNLRTQVVSARMSEALELLRLPCDTETLSLWLSMFAPTTDVHHEGSNAEEALLQHVDVEGTSWFRVYLPESQSYLVVPDTAQAALARLSQDVPSTAAVRYDTDVKALNELLQPSDGSTQVEKLIPEAFFKSPEHRAKAVESLQSKLADLPEEAAGARARLVLACCVLQPNRDFSEQLLALSTALGAPLAAEYRELAEHQQKTQFETRLAKLVDSKKGGERNALWLDVDTSFAAAGDTVRTTLSATIARHLPQLLEDASVAEQPALARLMGGVSGPLDSKTLKALYTQNAVLSGRKNTAPELLEALSRLTSTAPTDDGAAEYAVKNEVVAELLAGDKITAAWNALLETPAAVASMDGSLAAGLLERINTKMLSSDMALTTALLGLAANTRSLSKAFYTNPKRYRMFLNDAITLRHLGRALDDGPSVGADSFVVDWIEAAKSLPGFVESYMAESQARPTSFMSATYAGVASRKTRHDAMLFLEKAWEHVRRSSIDSSAIGVFVATGLLAAFNTPYPDSIDAAAPVQHRTLKQWQAAIRQVPEHLRLDPSYFLSAMFLSQNAFVDTFKTLDEVIDAWNAKPVDRVVATGLALTAFTKLAESSEALSLDGLRLADRLLSKIKISAVPWVKVRKSETLQAQKFTSLELWQNVHADFFLQFIAAGDAESAHKVFERIYALFPDPGVAELHIRDAMNDGTPKERAAWNAFGMQLLMNSKISTPNMTRMAQLLIGSADTKTLIEFTKLRGFLQPVPASDELALQLDAALKASPASLAALKTELDSLNYSRLSIQRRVGLEPLMRAYLNAESSEPISSRLANVCRWIGASPDQPIPEALSPEDTGVAVHMLVAMGPALFAGLDTKAAAARFRNLLQEVMKQMFPAGNVRDLIRAAKPALPAVIALTNGIISLQIRGLLEQAKHSEVKRNTAFRLTVNAHLVCSQVLLHEDAKVAERLEAFLVGTMGEHIDQDRVALTHMAGSFKAVAAGRVATPNIDKALDSVKEHIIDNAVVEMVRGFPALRASFTDTIFQMIASRQRDALTNAIYDLLFAGLYTGEMGPANESRLHTALISALAEPLNRRAVEVVLRGWNNINAAKSPLGAGKNVTRLFNARAALGPISGAEVLTWLETAVNHRKTSKETKIWDDLMLNVVNHALPGALSSLTTAQTQLITDLSSRIQRGDGRGKGTSAAGVLAEIAKLRQSG